MFERIRDWLAARGRRDSGRTYPTAPPRPELTAEEEAQAREQLAGEEREPGRDGET